MSITVWPMLFFTRGLARMFARTKDGPSISLDEIRVMTTAGMSQGAFGSFTGELIHNASRLRDLTAKGVMVSRDRVTYLSGNCPTEDNLKRVTRTNHSRFPYTPTGELDDVKGVGGVFMMLLEGIVVGVGALMCAIGSWFAHKFYKGEKLPFELLAPPSAAEEAAMLSGGKANVPITPDVAYTGKG